MNNYFEKFYLYVHLHGTHTKTFYKDFVEKFLNFN